VFGAEDGVGLFGGDSSERYRASYGKDEDRMYKFAKSLFHVIYIPKSLSLKTPGRSGFPPVILRLILILAASLINKNKAIIDVAQLFVLRHNTSL